MRQTRWQAVASTSTSKRDKIVCGLMCDCVHVPSDNCSIAHRRPSKQIIWKTIFSSFEAQNEWQKRTKKNSQKQHIRKLCKECRTWKIITHTLRVCWLDIIEKDIDIRSVSFPLCSWWKWFRLYCYSMYDARGRIKWTDNNYVIRSYV